MQTEFDLDFYFMTLLAQNSMRFTKTERTVTELKGLNKWSDLAKNHHAVDFTNTAAGKKALAEAAKARTAERAAALAKRDRLTAERLKVRPQQEADLEVAPAEHAE